MQKSLLAKSLFLLISLIVLMSCSLFSRTSESNSANQQASLSATSTLAAAKVTPTISSMKATQTAVPSTDEPESTLAAATQPLPTNTPTATIEPAVGIPELIHFVPGAGGPGDCSGTDETVPIIRFGNNSPFQIEQQHRLFCIYNFPINTKVLISFYDPKGNLAAVTNYAVLEVTEPWLTGSSQSVIAINFDPGLFYEYGEWRIIAESGGQTAERRFAIGICPPFLENQPRSDGPYHYQAHHEISVRSSTNAPDSLIDPASFGYFQPGDRIEIYGACYPPNTRLPVAVYGSPEALHQGAPPLELKKVVTVETDLNGSFTVEMEIDQGMLFDGSGGVFAVLPVTEGMSPVLTSDRPDLLALPFGGFQVDFRSGKQPVCASDTTLQIGEQITSVRDTNVFSRSNLFSQSAIEPIGVIPAEEPIEIFDGPLCIKDRAFWQVHGLSNGTAGWANITGTGN